MAPRGAKRAATASKEEPEAKRVAAFLKQHGVTKSTHEAIREVVQHPLAGLPAECRDMLLAMLPWSLSIPSDLRLDAHSAVVKMVEEVAEGIQTHLREAVQAESAKVCDMDEKKTDRQAALQSAEETLSQASEAVEERKRELAEASAALLQQKRDLAEGESKAKKDAADLEKIQAQKQDVESTVLGSFQKLKRGEWELGEEDNLFQPVQALIAQLDLDESLVTSLPVSLKKQERGAFDQVVVDKFEETLRDKIVELASGIETMESTTAANALAVDDAKAAFEGAQAKQQEVAALFGAAREASTRASAKLREAEAALLAFEPEYEKVTAARKTKAEELESFEAYHLCILKMMVEKASKKKETQLAQEAADAEQRDEENDQVAVDTDKKEESVAARASADATQASAAEAGA